MQSAQWGQGPLAVLDVEATSREPSDARIVELALLLIHPDGRRDPSSIDFLVDPGIEIPEDSTAVHGITTADCRRRGVAPHRALAESASMLTTIANTGVPLVMYNARYDWPLLLCEATRHRVEMPGGVQLIDAMLLHDRVAPACRRGRSLRSAARTYGVSHRRAHRAGADAQAAVQVVRKILRAHPWLGRTSLLRLQTDQQRWFEDWRAGFNARHSADGYDERVVGGWPRSEPSVA